MIQFESLKNPISFSDALKLQTERVQARINDEISDTVLFLEHLPVVTRGRGLQRPAAASESAEFSEKPRAMPFTPSLLPSSIEYAECERGGDLTYHGPGQLIIYPIFKLDGSSTFAGRHDVAHFIRQTETVVMAFLNGLAIESAHIPDATGVWVKQNGKKIASMGIAVKKWVTYHGIAINIVNDLDPFRLFSPCGFEPEVMTRLKDLNPREKETTGDRWRPECEARLTRAFVASHTRPNPAANPPATL